MSMAVAPSSSSSSDDSGRRSLHFPFPYGCCVLLLFLAAAISFDNFLIMPFVIAYSGFTGSVSPLGSWVGMRLSTAGEITCCSGFVSSICGSSLCTIGGLMII